MDSELYSNTHCVDCFIVSNHCFYTPKKQKAVYFSDGLALFTAFLQYKKSKFFNATSQKSV